MLSQTLDILALSETRLDNTFTDAAVSIEGFSLVRRDRCRSGGGVAFYIRNVIDYKIRSDFSDPDLEFLAMYSDSKTQGQTISSFKLVQTSKFTY